MAILNHRDKPPLGLTPAFIWIRERQSEIIEAMARYMASDHAIPKNWVKELLYLCEKEEEISK